MLDADGATKITDLEKLENQVCICCDIGKYHVVLASVKVLVLGIWKF